MDDNRKIRKIIKDTLNEWWGEQQSLNEKLVLGKNERVTVSTQEITAIKDIPQGNSAWGKPRGLWYAFGDSWIHYTKTEFGDDSHHSFKSKTHAYKIYPDFSKIIVLKTKNDVDGFVKAYLQKEPDKYNHYDIEWGKVANDYSGIEIPTYRSLGMRGWHDNNQDSKNRYYWLYTWDVPSGCIWKSDGVSKFKNL